jgi:hypothetical protein
MYDFDGDYATFYTGENDIRTSGLFDTFDGSTNLPQWSGDHCSNIQGASDGTKFKSFMQENETLLFFRKSMCRPQRLVRRLFANFSSYFVFAINKSIYTIICRQIAETCGQSRSCAGLGGCEIHI